MSFSEKVVTHNLFKAFLDSSNASIERQGLKLSNGKYVSADATLIQSARRPRKKLSSTKLADGTYETGEVEYADDVAVSWMSKGDKLLYGYSSTVVTDEHGVIC